MFLFFSAKNYEINIEIFNGIHEQLNRIINHIEVDLLQIDAQVIHHTNLKLLLFYLIENMY